MTLTGSLLTVLERQLKREIQEKKPRSEYDAGVKQGLLLAVKMVQQQLKTVKEN